MGKLVNHRGKTSRCGRNTRRKLWKGLEKPLIPIVKKEKGVARTSASKTNKPKSVASKKK
jgi:hypothetical protein